MTTVKRKAKQLGQILIEQGLITPAQLEQALEEHRKTPESLGRVLIDLQLIKEADLVRALAEQVGLEFVDLADYHIDPSSTMLLPDALARRYRAIPIGERDGKLLVAMSDPANVYALDDIRTITNRDVQPVVATAADVEQAIQKFAGMDGQVEALASQASEQLRDRRRAAEAALEEAPRQAGPGDHDPGGRRPCVGRAHRADRAGRPRPVPRGRRAPRRHALAEEHPGGLISRLKVMADLNIAEKRVPQDGRISMRVGGRTLDLRVATLPTVYGEKIVIRVLDKSQALLRLEDLGFSMTPYKRFSASFSKPYGAILVTGPTGSGKSTTMYATLNILNEEDRNIITVEDPVEYRLDGVNQMQVNPKAGLTFASALRSILRADPDIVLIGEIRDKETATIAIEAALTGHLVLSSLHTNDAASAISRLVEMEVETFLVASAIDCVVAQRLFRVLCERCKEAYKPEHSELVAAGYPEWLIPEIETLFRHRLLRMLEHRVPRPRRPVRSHADDRRDPTAHG